MKGDGKFWLKRFLIDHLRQTTEQTEYIDERLLYRNVCDLLNYLSGSKICFGVLVARVIVSKEGAVHRSPFTTLSSGLRGLSHAQAYSH